MIFYIFTVCRPMQTFADHVFGSSDAVFCHLSRGSEALVSQLCEFCE